MYPMDVSYPYIYPSSGKIQGALKPKTQVLPKDIIAQPWLKLYDSGLAKLRFEIWELAAKEFRIIHDSIPGIIKNIDVLNKLILMEKVGTLRWRNLSSQLQAFKDFQLIEDERTKVDSLDQSLGIKVDFEFYKEQLGILRAHQLNSIRELQKKDSVNIWKHLKWEYFILLIDQGLSFPEILTEFSKSGYDLQNVKKYFGRVCEKIKNAKTPGDLVYIRDKITKLSSSEFERLQKFIVEKKKRKHPAKKGKVPSCPEEVIDESDVWHESNRWLVFVKGVKEKKTKIRQIIDCYFHHRDAKKAIETIKETLSAIREANNDDEILKKIQTETHLVDEDFEVLCQFAKSRKKAKTTRAVK